MASTRRRGREVSVSNTVGQTIFETVEAPRLRGLTTADFVSFKNDRDVYERRIAEKNSDSNVHVQMTTYNDSIDASVLQIFAIGDWVPVDKVEEITEQHLKDCVAKNSIVQPTEFDLARLEQELRSLKMDRPGPELSLDACVRKLVLDYTQLLNSPGYKKFIVEHPKIAVEHVLKMITHEQLRNCMVITAKLLKGKEFRKNFNAFVRKMSSEAKTLDLFFSSKRYKPSASDHIDELATPVVDDAPPKSHRMPRGSGHRGRKKNKRSNVEPRLDGPASKAKT